MRSSSDETNTAPIRMPIAVVATTGQNRFSTGRHGAARRTCSRLLKGGRQRIDCERDLDRDDHRQKRHGDQRQTEPERAFDDAAGHEDARDGKQNRRGIWQPRIHRSIRLQAPCSNSNAALQKARWQTGRSRHISGWNEQAKWNAPDEIHLLPRPQCRSRHQQSLHEGRMPREKHLRALGLRAEQFTALKLR
jgi:hypothetical protein